MTLAPTSPLPVSSHRLTYTDPSTSWMAGLACLGGGVVFLIWGLFEHSVDWGAYAFFGVGILLLLTSSNLTVTADGDTRTLSLRYDFWIVLHRTRTIPFDDIADIQCQETRTHSSRGGSHTVWRLIVVRKDGKVLPFRFYYGADRDKKHAAVQLREAITGKKQSDIPSVPSRGALLTM